MRLSVRYSSAEWRRSDAEVENASTLLKPMPVPPLQLLRGANVFLDFDGTLVEIAERPDAVRVNDRLATLMQGLWERLEGRMAVISGRSAGEVRALLGINAMTVVGSHGLEFCWGDGRIEAVERPAALECALAAMRELAAAIPGVLVEDKPLGAALHFRQAPSAEQACMDLAGRLAPELGLKLQSGKMMVELRADGGDKGSAIRRLMQEPVFAAARPLFFGDDVTDEPGFAAAQEMAGSGVLIGPVRISAAQYRLDGVAAMLDWLETASEVTA
ncbi:trehalose-phosphatase [Caenibius sp. WL]|uniref:trehalose-phosphatase n=1 Tax=Caenibius sp. WL TaxID=2872646 RepID=UPI001C9917D0|nr:trehalose-phosphatase [Caenibius sp. WL]